MRAAEQEFREAPRRQRRLSRRGVGLRTLLAVLLVLLVATSALGLALFTGAISIAQQPPVPEPNPSTAVSSAPQTAAAPTPEAARPKVTKQQTYGDWIYVCVESPQGAEVRCSISQQLSDKETKANVFAWQIAQDGKGGLVAAWVTPIAVLLSRGVVIDAGSPQPISVPYETCGGSQCRAVAALAPDYVETLTKSAKATATIVLRDGRAINLPISITGLSDGLAALKAPATP